MKYNKILLSILLIFSITIFLATLTLATSNSSCEEEWSCDSWSSCINGERERECYDTNHCGTTYDKPSEERSCYSYRDRYYDDFYNYYPGHRGFCDPNNYYSENHFCYDFLRDRFRSGYYDYYEYELMNYYQNKYENQNNNQYNDEQPIQVINVQYPGDTNRYEQEYRENYREKYWENFNLVSISILTILILVLLLIILVIVLRR